MSAPFKLHRYDALGDGMLVSSGISKPIVGGKRTKSCSFISRIIVLKRRSEMANKLTNFTSFGNFFRTSLWNNGLENRNFVFI